ncbi:ApbA domain-containing protein [Rhizoctonia solani AG-1 IA]|uniref:ApbA domain-containing protein n=1 Tax=Thanatephorus cucumeris (strain AG1-IA) TaxID=983506 RepID=L8X5I0_THACA|nr:ApbA domain-containing protein [Rhizoctonia solani AG-1 IA]
MSAPVKVCVVGFGALGTVYSFIMEKAGAQVTVVCRSNYSLMQEHGIDICSEKLNPGVNYLGWRPHRSTSGFRFPSQIRYILSRTKGYHTRCLPDVVTTPKLLGPLLARSRNFVLIQNGIGIELDLQAAVPSGIVMSGCAWIDATVIDHGRTLKHGPIVSECAGETMLAPPSGTPHSTEAHTALTTFVDLLKAGGGTPEQVVDIQAANAGFSTFATLANATLPDICHEPARSYTMPIVRGFMEEVVSVARGLGLDESVLPVASIDEAIDLTLSEYGVAGPAYKASMLVDFLAERPMEIEVIIGGILRYAVAKQVPAPRFAIPAFIQRPMFHLNFAFRLSTAYALLKVHQTRFIQKSKSRA